MVNFTAMKAIQGFLLAGALLISGAAAETYTVKAGDTVYSVSRAHNLDPEELLKLNKLSSATIQVGQKLEVGAAPKAVSAPQAVPQRVAPKTTTHQGGIVRTAALRFLGIAYHLGSTGGGALDCSAFTRSVMAQLGVRLPRTSREQYGSGSPVARGDLRAGDLIFFNTLGRGVSHVGIYLGGGQFAHANSYLGRSVIEDLGVAYYSARYVGARRVLP